MNSRWHPEISAKQPCYLPYGKADGTASPALSRACGKLLQLYPWRLGSTTLDFCNVRINKRQIAL